MQILDPLLQWSGTERGKALDQQRLWNHMVSRTCRTTSSNINDLCIGAPTCVTEKNKWEHHNPHSTWIDLLPSMYDFKELQKTWENKELKSRHAYLIGLPQLSMLLSAPSHSASATYSLVFSYKNATKVPLPPSFHRNSSQTLKFKTLNSRELSATTNTVFKKIRIIRSRWGPSCDARSHVWDKLFWVVWATSVCSFLKA